MRLPNAEHAVVDLAKIVDYLLSDTHAEGRGKAQIFRQFGFSPSDPEILRHALLHLARNNEVATVQSSSYGTKYVIEGPLMAPDGRTLVIRTVWIIDAGTSNPRFITAFPGKRPSP
jgi:hypothetical protein